MMRLDQKIEGVLFYKAEPMKVTFLSSFFGVSEEEVRSACAVLEERLQEGATSLILTDTEVSLALRRELGECIESLRRDEMRSSIGKAGAETLAIILYRGPLSRADIDRVRGVNSTFILRNLLIRGLIERREHPTHKQSFVYAATPLLLEHLGIRKREELPDFEEIMNALDSYEKEQEEQQAAHPKDTAVFNQENTV